MTDLLRERYELLETLGAGGEGRVVKALDHQHSRLVALKIVSVRSDGDREDLLAEARILLGLAPHPALPLVREDFFDGDDYVIAMDWVDGTDLARLVRARGHPGLGPSSVLAYLADAADALTYLHTQDEPIVHGDVKPANLILSRGGRVKLVDFGMSSVPASRRRRAGTPGFRAPELAAGAHPSRASDVYALAATAFTLLTGSVPSGVLPSWDGIDPDQAARLEEVIRLGLATDPARRPPTPGEFVERLRAGWGASLPTGVMTFCLSDIVGATAQWEEDPDAMASALVRHDELIAEAVETHGGHFLRSMGEGDSTFSIFDSATDALEAAIAATEALTGEEWPGELELTVRFGLHTGEAERRATDHFGPAVNLAARLRGQADGGQVFLSSLTAELVAESQPDGYRLVDLGPHRLRGLGAPERVFALAGPSVVAPLPATECPYRGLEAFEASDRHFFFGREDVVAELTARLASGSLLALVGASGSGKSSVLRAGLVGAAREGLIAGVTSVELCTPGSAPPLDGPCEPEGLLVVDQFEELFSLTTDAATRDAFIDALLAHPGPVVIGIRADFYGRLSTHAELARAVANNQILLGAMNADELRRAITEPARVGGLRLESGLVDVILRDVASEPGALPLLSHALRATWELRDGRTLTVDGYRETGGVSSAIARTADRIVQTTPAELHALLRNVFVRLTDIGDGVEDTRRRVEIGELVPEGGSTAAVDAMLGQLADARLVTLREGTAEVAHEALIREWPALRAWLEEDKEGLRLHRRLGDAARLWAVGGHEPSDLYRGTRLEAAREWAEAKPQALNATERAFLDAGLELADRERADQERQVKAKTRTNRRLRALLATTAVFLVVALVAGAFAVQRGRDAGRQRDTAALEALVNRSLALRQTDRRVAALLAVEAYRRAPDDPRVHSALLGTFTGAPGFIGYLRLPEDDWPLHGAAAVPGTTTAVVALRGRDLHLVDLDTGQLDERFPALDDLGVAAPDRAKSEVRVSADGSHVAHLAGTGGPCCAALLVYEVASGERVLGPVTPPVIGHGDVAISADGSLVAVAGLAVAGGYDSKVAVYRTATGEHIGTVPGVPPPDSLPNVRKTAAVAFGPDGRLYAGGLGNEVLVIDPGAAAIVESYDVPPRSGNNNVAVIGDGLVVTSGDVNLVALDSTTGAQRWSADITVPGDPSPCPYLAVAAPVGRLYCGDFYGALDERELATGELTGGRLDLQEGGIADLSVAGDGAGLVVFGAEEPVVSRWRLDGSGPIAETTRPGWSTNGYDPSGRLMIIYEGQRESLQDLTLNPQAPPPPDFAVWDPTTGEIVDELDGIVASIWSAPERLAAAFDDGSSGAYDLRSHARLEVGAGGEAEVHNAGLAAGGDRVYVTGRLDDGSDDRCEVWSIDANLELAGPVIDVGECGPIGTAGTAANADGSLVAYTRIPPEGGAETVVYDGRTGARRPGELRDLYTVAISPDGTLFGGDFTGNITEYDLETLEPIGTFPRAPGRAEVIEFSADGSIVLVGSQTRTVSLYDASTRTSLGDPIEIAGVLVGNNAGPVLRPDGKAVAINRPDGLAIWNIEPEHLAAAACRLAGRNLTRSEWDTYLGRLGDYRPTCSEYE